MFFLARKAYKKYNASSAANAKLADPETEATGALATMTAEPSSGNDPRLAEFLTTSKEKYLNDIRATPSKGNEWVVVMGNEAGDLDSVASSIAYAWFRSKEYNEKAIPLLQLNRSDLDLRAENTYALSLAGITQPKEQLLFLDDIPSFSLTNPTTPFPSCTFSLVDHNTLGSAYTFDNPAANVNAILDHHADEGHHLNASPRIISSCGSCTSHVASVFFSFPEAEFPATLATLLLTGILIDTNGLKPGGKAENTDHTAAGFLAPRSTLAPSLPQNLITTLTTDPSAQADALHDTPAIKGLTKKLREIKEDVSRLSARDLLRRDYKEYAFNSPQFGAVSAGLASVPVRLRDWNLAEAVQGWMEEREIQVLGVLTSFKGGKNGNGQNKREMAWVVWDNRSKSAGEARSIDVKALAKELFKGLESNDKLRVKLKKKKYDLEKGGKLPGGARSRTYDQGNANANRKIVAPALKDILGVSTAEGAEVKGQGAATEEAGAAAEAAPKAAL